MITGQVGVVTKNPGWYGRAVQWFTGSPAYHTVSAVSETECVSAETPVVVVRPVTHFPGIVWTDVEFPDEAHRRDAVRFLNAQVGHGYAYFDILLLVVARILRQRTPYVIRRRLVDRRQWFCSELSDAGMVAGGVNLFPGRLACAVIPKDWLAVVDREHAAV